MRPNFTTWALSVASAVASRGDCTRRQVGAVILDRDDRICGAGYNGTYRGRPGCLKGACPRGRHYQAADATRNWRLGNGETVGDLVPVCACGNEWPCPDAVPSGSSYDTGPGACIAVHAELNALLDVSEKARLESSTLYVTARPCDGCLKIIRNTSIYRLVWLEEDGQVDELVWPFS